MLGLGLGQGPGNALAVLFFLLVLCGEHLRLCWFGSLCKYATDYLRYHVMWLATSVPRIE